MAWVQMFLDFLAAIAWPSAVAATLWVFRTEIRKALSFLESLKLPGGMEATFRERARIQEQQTEAVTERIVQASGALSASSSLEVSGEIIKGIAADANVDESGQTPPDFDTIERRILNLAQKSTRSAIVELRHEVLQIVRMQGANVGLFPVATTSLDGAAATLMDSDLDVASGLGKTLKGFDDFSNELLLNTRLDDHFRLAWISSNVTMPSLMYHGLITLGDSRKLRAAQGNK